MSSKIFSYETLVHALSGVCGSCVAMTLVIPLDTVRTRMILDETKKSKKITEVFIEILKEEGPLGWVRGGLSTIQAVAASNFIYFYTFHGLKKLIPTSEQSALKDLLFSCCAGAMNVLITNPLWVVNTRMKTQDDAKLKGLVHGLFRIGIKEGLGSLWNGTGASLILVSNPALKFTTYEYLKRIFYGNSNSPSPSTAFFTGAFASVIATIITYPVQIVQTNLRILTYLKKLFETLVTGTQIVVFQEMMLIEEWIRLR